MRRRLAVLALAAGAALTATPATPAAIEGPCEASVSGIDVRNRETGWRSAAIEVPETARPVVAMTASRPIARATIEFELFGLAIPLHEETVTGRSWEHELPVDEYSTWGVGLYKVVATSAGTGFTCTATTLIDVQGSAIATVAGLAALGLAVAGAVGVLVLIMRGGRAGGQPFAGIFFGSLLGVGVGALLQQLGVLYPTIPVAVAVVGAGAAVGFLAGMVGFRPLE